ncbi:hypothetical protein C095_01360 [Fusobacterium necrophorum subsp. funduliforme B35]|uniref:Uncharacterized protein n=1 Tax=Fusobacterium necrophorum subsp. funduliforme B35 TaxID=1226633 RepID=A0A0B4ESR2_9FUSO|nr:hypothetical protein C095_01360 [Fusobacterium necrophorum subsp. funduliforme B35]
MEDNKRLKSWLKRKVRITEALFVAFLISGSVVYADTSAGLAIGENGEVISEITNGYYPSIISTKKSSSCFKRNGCCGDVFGYIRIEAI